MARAVKRTYLQNPEKIVGEQLTNKAADNDRMVKIL